MLKELYEQIVADARDSVAPSKMDLPDGKVLIIAPGLAPTILPRDTVRFKDQVASMTSLLDWCANEDTNGLVIKVMPSKIEATANRFDPSGSDSAQFNLEHSKAYVDLMDWVSRPRAIQDVVKGLRTALAGTFDEKYLPIFRRVDFSRKNDGTRSVSHTGESLGKSVEAKAQSSSGKVALNQLIQAWLINRHATVIEQHDSCWVMVHSLHVVAQLSKSCCCH
jgi:hypothetical protein